MMERRRSIEISLAEGAGFCPGVQRADKAIWDIVEKPNHGKIYTLGKLIHNRIYIEALKENGVEEIEIAQIEETMQRHANRTIHIVIRTHGITKSDSELLARLSAQYQNLNVIDMTCPYVKRIHRLAESNTGPETVFLLFCDPNHPEARGIMSYAAGEKHAFSKLEDVANLNFGKKIPILCAQTTQNLLEFEKIKKILKKLYTNLIFFDTICSVTENRQKEAVSLAKRSDAMIVIGGRDSSNTRKLYELCKAECGTALWIESANELTSSSLPDGAQKIGITAGASTPEDIILEVIKQWKKN